MFTTNEIFEEKKFQFFKGKEFLHNIFADFMIDKYNYIINTSQNMNKVCEMNRLDLDETFSDLLKLKARDPMHSFIVDNIYIPVFYGYLPINKGDTLDVVAGRINDDTVLIKYTAHKKKLKTDIDIYLRTLSII